ncbi:hypothetical protein [Ulvibacter litoralis]|uniref:EF hand n=1 Tax=Ulvibacter litoralis TaxID=227084 RepID=A0A1G7HGP5_9FLAO|nr:hypothetical protein [Ulvibacter litoralis]GHC57746.1 hypothetical protein GCM10008083_22950 [Ulvibacter litoralis]SDE99585.1 EF hand [Ulvibacter litoralis]
MKNISLKRGIVTMVIALAFTSYASAQSEKGQPKTPPSAEELLKQMDKDEDGLLSKEEIKGPLKDDFDKVDSNEDGFLSKEELEKAPKPKGNKPPKREH